jgi:hypothetical protein
MAFFSALFGIGLGALFMYLYLVDFQGYRKP